MTPEFITSFFSEGLKVAIMLAAPALMFGLVAGVAVSIFQTATSINEMTLVFIPKMLAVGVSLLIFSPWMIQIVVEFTRNIFINIPNYVR